MFNKSKKDQYFIKTASKELNDFLQGGFHKGVITQIYGEAGCGKSNLAILSTIGVKNILLSLFQETFRFAIQLQKNNLVGIDLPLQLIKK